MWFVQMVDFSGVLFNICVFYCIIGDIDLVRLCDVVNVVVCCYWILCIIYFVGDDGVVQLIVYVDFCFGWI